MLSAPVCFVWRLTADLSNPVRLTTDLRECSRDVLWSRKIEGIEIFAKGRYRQMSVDTQAVLAGAKAAGLVVVSSAVGQDFSGNPTTRFTLGLVADQAKTQVLELSDRFDFSKKELL